MSKEINENEQQNAALCLCLLTPPTLPLRCCYGNNSSRPLASRAYGRGFPNFWLFSGEHFLSKQAVPKLHDEQRCSASSHILHEDGAVRPTDVAGTS